MAVARSLCKPQASEFLIRAASSGNSWTVNDYDSLKANIPRLKLRAWKKAAEDRAESLWDLIEAAVDVEVTRRAAQPKRWNPDHDILLGTMSDAALSRDVGASIAQVKHRRKQLGIAPFSPAGRPKIVKLPGVMNAIRFSFIERSLGKRFPEREQNEIELLLSELVSIMGQSKNKNRVQRFAVRVLERWRETGSRPDIQALLQESQG